MVKPKFCEKGLYNFDIQSYFAANGLAVSPGIYSDSKYKHVGNSLIYNKKQTYISHDIWLTHPQKPRQISLKNIDLIKNKILIMDEQNVQWTHILWVNCDLEIAQTKELLQGVNIEFKNINQVTDLSGLTQHLLPLIEKGLFGIAKDMLQWFILHKYGGFSTDVNFVMFESPEFLMNKYDFFAQTLPGCGFIITPSMVYASKSHPIILETFERLMTHKADLLKIYELYPDCDVYNLTLVITYMPFLLSFYKNANRNGTIDVAIDPQVAEVNQKIWVKNFPSELAHMILADFNFDTLICDSSEEYRRYEEYLLSYENYGVCFSGHVIGVDLGEDSWII